jgi:hypothetical protein
LACALLPRETGQILDVPGVHDKAAARSTRQERYLPFIMASRSSEIQKQSYTARVTGCHGIF